MKTTINGLLNMQKHLGKRRAELQELRLSSANTTTWRQPEKVEEPIYDIVTCDEMLVEVDTTLMEIDLAIKETNAKTSVDLDVDLKHLLRAIPKKI